MASILPGVELPGSTGHLVDLDVVQIVVTGDGKLVVLRLCIVVAA